MSGNGPEIAQVLQIDVFHESSSEQINQHVSKNLMRKHKTVKAPFRTDYNRQPGQPA
jgi:hypothetical protein